LNLTWRDVDLDAKILTVTDTKNHLTHKLPLPDYLFDLLLERKEKSGKYVLSGPDGTRFSAFRYAQARIKALTGIEVSPHDLRRTFATAASRLSISAYAVKMLLNHKGSNDVTGGYIQLTVEDLREPMQRICDFFLTKGGLRGGKVIQLPGRAANYE
ncbi:MAG: tyrosine-type recombinase/integrase, partial [Desulfatibacillaceae bacterium]|nr:tyrosine-type recombinase/integrase [Desulfatibacillaceae bacterium]